MESLQTPNTPNTPQTAEPVPQEEMMSPEVVQWFKDHPTSETALALSLEDKRNFISFYYTKEVEMEEAISKGLSTAEDMITKEIASGKNKFPFSENLVVGLIEMAKLKSIDTLIEDIGKIYTERRAKVSGKDITDNAVMVITQQYMAKIAYVVQEKLALTIEGEVKARNLPVNQLMPLIVNFLMGDLSFLVDIEKYYNLKIVSDNADKACDIEKLTSYISESITISALILEGKIAQGNLFLFPHMLSDRLFNLTGYESEQIVHYIRTLNASKELTEELTNLIIEEAYAVEKSKKECFSKFDEQMIKMEEQFVKQMEAAQLRKLDAAKNQKKGVKAVNPIGQDKAMMKMISMGLSVPGLPTMRIPGMNKPVVVKKVVEKKETKKE